MTALRRILAGYREHSRLHGPRPAPTIDHSGTPAWWAGWWTGAPVFFIIGVAAGVILAKG